MSRVIVVPFDQLSLNRGVMGNASPSSDEILMVRSEAMISSRTWHAQRLHLVLSAAAHHAVALRDLGYTVHEISAPTLADGVRAHHARHPGCSLVATEPRSRPLRAALVRAGVELVPDDSFLTPRGEFSSWSNERLPVMETFYRRQRVRLGILVNGSEPIGGKWNLDADNRLPPPKGEHAWPAPLVHELDEIDRAVWDDIVDQDLPVVGTPPNGTWATTRAGALRQLNHFIESSLAGFGPYEDAMPANTWSVHHSLLSPYLNLGLLDPDEVVAAAVDRHARGDVPLSSIEGFIRQVIGWREFINGVYWSVDSDYEHLNELSADQPLPAAYDDPELTQMACLRSTVSDVQRRGWVHHIPRLMILANLSLIAGVRPQELLAWMRRMFVDAADWVMVPNVIGMGVHADGGAMMTKPYAAGGAYISRMSRHCSACPFNPKIRTGPDACPFTTLYWDFLARNADAFQRNPRMAAQVSSARRLADIDEVRLRAAQVRLGLASGTI